MSDVDLDGVSIDMVKPYVKTTADENGRTAGQNTKEILLMLRSSRSSVPLIVSMALLTTLASGAAFGQLSEPAGKPLALQSGDAFPLYDGIVVDMERQMAFLLTPVGSLDAIDLRAGARVWTAGAAKPLLVVGRLLIAQADAQERGRLDIVSFDAESGAAGHLKARVELPGTLMGRLSDPPGKSFRVHAGLVGDRVVLSWSATESGAAQGYLEAAEDGHSVGATPKASQRLTGTVELDLASGAVKPFTKALAGFQPMGVLASIGNLKGRLYTSADGRHVLESKRNPDGGVWQSYRWTIYERQSRERIGELTHVSSASPFVVAGTNLIFVSQASMRAEGNDIVSVPLRLQAVDLASGATLWTKEGSDPNFRGEPPP